MIETILHIMYIDKEFCRCRYSDISATDDALSIVHAFIEQYRYHTAGLHPATETEAKAAQLSAALAAADTIDKYRAGNLSHEALELRKKLFPSLPYNTAPAAGTLSFVYCEDDEEENAECGNIYIDLQSQVFFFDIFDAYSAEEYAQQDYEDDYGPFDYLYQISPAFDIDEVYAWDDIDEIRSLFLSSETFAADYNGIPTLVMKR